MDKLWLIGSTPRGTRTGRRVRAVLRVHLLGHPVDMGPLVKIARAYGLMVIEDAAESLTPGGDVSHEMPVIDEDEASNPERQNGQKDLKLNATSLSDERSALRKKAAEQGGVRVTGGTGPLINRNGDANRAADAEHWTVAFEESQGRYPLPVANLVGSVRTRPRRKTTPRSYSFSTLIMGLTRGQFF